MRRGQTRESVKLALETLRSNKLRSGLTVLGIVIGVTTVIVISSVVNGLNNRVQTGSHRSGPMLIWVHHLPMIQLNMTSEQLTRKPLTLEDALALRGLPHIVAADGEKRHVDEQFRIGNVKGGAERSG